ncbi:uncharacterized protein METZ01_LOCUS263530, partial [marine metagenome]
PLWVKVTIRPVEICGILHYQVSHFDGKQGVSSNHEADAFGEVLDTLLSAGFSNFHVQNEAGDLHVRITKRGKALISHGRPPLIQQRHRLEHNREKNYLLTSETGRDVLVAVEIGDLDGRIKPSMQAKFRQVNAFLKLLDEKLQVSREDTVRIVDCGCGSAFLTLSAYAYLSSVKNRKVALVGIDQNERLIEKCRGLVAELGWKSVSFYAARIADYEPESPPDILLSLHACDLATDEALAQAVHWDTDLVLAAPCCQQELSGQLRSDIHRPVLKHGILKQRTADILTDAVRSDLLQIAGYRSEVIEFISSEETSKNLMIRAERGLRAEKSGSENLTKIVDEYRELKA